MDKNDTNELELSSLEARIDELITTIESLTVENTVLKTHQNRLTIERTELINKTEQARTRVAGMITRLKALENRCRLYTYPSPRDRNRPRMLPTA